MSDKPKLKTSFTVEDFMRQTGWDRAKVLDALVQLERAGLIVVNRGEKGGANRPPMH